MSRWVSGRVGGLWMTTSRWLADGMTDLLWALSPANRMQVNVPSFNFIAGSSQGASNRADATKPLPSGDLGSVPSEREAGLFRSQGGGLASLSPG